MTKLGLIEKLQESLADLKGVDMATRKRVDLSINAAQAAAVYDSLVDIIRSELEDTGESSLPGLVMFRVAHRPARIGRDPTTGQALNLPAKNVVIASPVKALKDSALGAKLPVKRTLSEEQRAAATARLKAISARRQAALQQAA